MESCKLSRQLGKPLMYRANVCLFTVARLEPVSSPLDRFLDMARLARLALPQSDALELRSVAAVLFPGVTAAWQPAFGVQRTREVRKSIDSADHRLAAGIRALRTTCHDSHRISVSDARRAINPSRPRLRNSLFEACPADQRPRELHACNSLMHFCLYDF
jgi:hypothetical protein